MYIGKKLAATMALIGAITTGGVLAAAPANATIRPVSSCSVYPEFEIVKASAPTEQCFYWDGTWGWTLNVGDWYEAVESFGMNLTVKWTEQYTHNVITQTTSTNGDFFPQPAPNGDPNYMLTSVTDNG